MDEIIEEWFARHFHGLGPKLDTELYNLVYAAKDDLKRILSAPGSTSTTGSTTLITASESEE
jgi:hypothetical protein